MVPEYNYDVTDFYIRNVVCMKIPQRGSGTILP